LLDNLGAAFRGTPGYYLLRLRVTMCRVSAVAGDDVHEAAGRAVTAIRLRRMLQELPVPS
jgi:hypothetical protein